MARPRRRPLPRPAVQAPVAVARPGHQPVEIGARDDSRPWKSASRERAGEYWVTAKGDADADLLADLPEIRRRSRDALRNNPLAAAAVNTKVTSVIGSGLKLNASIDREALVALGHLADSDAAADAWEAQAEAEWRLFASSPNCDLARTLNFAEQQALAWRAVLENGDHFIPRVSLLRPRGDWPFRFALQHLEADRCCNPDERQDSARLIAGVEKDDQGAPLRYHFARLHPGAIRRSGQSQAWSSVPAFGERTGSRVCLHLYRQLRTGQTRGIPDLAPVLTVLKQLDRYCDAEVDRAVKSALFLAFVTTADGEGLAAMAPVDYNNDRGEYYREKKFDLDHSSVAALFPGDKIEFSDPKAPNAAADTFLTTFTRLIGAALEIPHEVLTQHFQSSYSAARGALLLAWQFFAGRRAWLAQALCQPVYEWVLTDAISQGRLQAPGFFTDPFARQAWLGAEWNGDAAPILDESKAIAAAEGRINLGISTRKAETAALTGSDYDQVRRQREKEARQEAASPTLIPAAPAQGPGRPAAPARDGAPPAQADDDTGDDDTGAARAKPTPSVTARATQAARAKPATQAPVPTQSRAVAPDPEE